MSKRIVHDVPATAHFDFLYGAFQLSKWRVPYLTTTMSLKEAAESLNLTAELPGAESIQWQLDELFQRDIDWPRVEGQVLPYLRNADQPQFFNSITVALLPFDDTVGELVESFDHGRAWDPPPLHDAEQRYAKSTIIGPLSFGFWSDWSTPDDAGFRSGQVRWNTNQIFGVAIDGQHRLAALKVLARESHSNAELQATRIPIILLVFAEELGFDAPSMNSQVELLRMLFIDLNKHAQTVSRARQILLDDRDPHAVCVRQIVTNRLSDHLDDLTAIPPQLPLSLVDWHSEQAKFDRGPYLTTVLGLDWIVGQALGTQPIRDYTNYPSIRSQIRQLRRSLEISLDAALERVDLLQRAQLSPFSYYENELDEIALAFADIWSGPLCLLLTRLGPYAELVGLRRSTNSLSLDFQHWFELREKAEADKYEGEARRSYRQLVGRLARRPENPILEATLNESLSELEDFKSRKLPFNVAFQRALVDGFLEYAKIGSEHVDELAILADDDYFDDVDFDEPEWSDDDDVEEEEEVEEDVAEPVPEDRSLSSRTMARAGEFVSALDGLFVNWPDVLHLEASFETDYFGGDEDNVPFWLGTLLRPEGGVDFTQGASRRAKDLLFAVAGLWLYDDRTEPGAGSDFDAFWQLCFDANAPSVCRRIRRAIDRFSKDTGAAGRILNAREEDYTESAALDEAYVRLRQIWEVLEL